MPKRPAAQPHPVTLSTFRGRSPHVVSEVTGSWRDFVDALPALLAVERADKLDLPAVTPCSFENGHRSNAEAGAHTALLIDVDAVPNLDMLLERCEAWRCVVYESPSSTDDAPRLRIIAALPAPYPAHAAPEARAAFARALGLDPLASGVSKAAAPAQIYFAGRVQGTRERCMWAFEGATWVPPTPGDAPTFRPTDTHPTEPTYSPERVPDLSRLVEEIEPDLASAEPWRYRGGRDVYRALGGWLARRGYHPDAIAEAVYQLPSTQPDVRAEQARETAEQLYEGDPRAAGFAALEHHFGPEVMAELEDAVTDPWVKRMAATWPPARPRVARAEAPDDSPPLDATADAALDALPEWVSNHVRATQEELRTPLDMNLINAIGVVACALSGRLKVRLHGAYTCHTALFCCSVADPGQLKSPAFRAAAAPIKAWVAERQDAERDDLERRRMARDKLEADVKRLAKAWSDGYDDDPDAPEAKDLREKRIALEAPAPVPTEFLVQDATPEALSDLLATHGRIACLSSDASKIFSILGGQYSKGQADLGVWLEAYDGEMKVVHRIGRDPVRPQHTQTTLSAVLSIQPQVLERITGNAAMVGEGLVQRLCWVVCPPAPPRWAEGEVPAPTPQDVAETWDAGVRFLLALNPGEVRVGDEAFPVYIAWRDELERRMHSGDLGGELRGWGAKHLERTVRIAAGLWACDGAEGREITAEQMARAVTIGRWLVPHAVRALHGGEASSDEAAVLACVAKRAALAGAPNGWVSRREVSRHVTPTRLRRQVERVLVPLLKDLVGRGALEADAELTKLRLPV